MKLLFLAFLLYYVIGVISWVLFTLYFEDEDVTVGKLLLSVLFLWIAWPITVRSAFGEKVYRKISRIAGKALFKKKATSDSR